MKFVFPEFLWALTLILIPIIIHLFNFRRYKLVYFSNVKFLQSIKKDSKSKSTLKNILVLITRVLAIVFLVLAFARPYIPENENNHPEKSKLVSIYIDNSFSLENSGVKGPLFEQAKVKAIESIGSFVPGTEFTLITNDFNPEYKHVVGGEQIKEWLQGLKISKTVRNVSEIVNYHNDVIVQEDTLRDHVLFLISDFQKSSCDIENLKSETNTNYFAVYLKQNINSNIIIDSVWFESPGHYINKEEKLLVKLKNESSDDLTDIPVQFFINDTLKGMANFSIPAGEQKVEPIPFIQRKYGDFYGKVSVSDYPVTFDNDIYFNYSINDKMKVLIISDNSICYPHKLYQSDSYFKADIATSKTIPYNILNSYRMIVIDGVKSITNGMASSIVEYVKSGGSIIVSPTLDINENDYCDFFRSMGLPCYGEFNKQRGQISFINYNHRVYESVFSKKPDKANLPYFTGYFSLKNSHKQVYNILLKTESGSAILTHHNSGEGEVYISCIPFSEENTNMVVHPLFIPFLYNSALQSGGFSNLYNVINPENVIEVENIELDNSVYLKKAGEERIVYPEVVSAGNGSRLYLNSSDIDEGHYELYSGDSKIKPVSFNYDRSESEMKQYTVEELNTLLTEKDIDYKIIDEIEDIKTKAKEWETGNYFHRLMLWLVLFFILAEVLLVRFYKRQS